MQISSRPAVQEEEAPEGLCRVFKSMAKPSSFQRFLSGAELPPHGCDSRDDYVVHVKVWYKGSRPHLTELEATESVRCGRLRVSAYAALATEALRQRRHLWKVRPKLHYLHSLDVAKEGRGNPMSLSN